MLPKKDIDQLINKIDSLLEITRGKEPVRPFATICIHLRLCVFL